MRTLLVVLALVIVSLGCRAQGNVTAATKSGQGSVSTTPIVDSTPPQISAIVCTPSDTAITCTFTTSEAAEVKVCRGATGGPYTVACEPSDYNGVFETSHSKTLSGLTAATQYFLGIFARDSAGNERECNTDGTGGSACPSATEITVTTDAAAVGNPPYGSTSTAVILPRSYTSSAFPYPAASTITDIDCSSSPCVVTTSADHNLLTGDFVHITGTGVASQTVDDSTITDCARTSPSTTVTCNTSADVHFKAGERVVVHGSNLSHIQGSWAVASASASQFTFTSLETNTVSLTTGTVSFAVAITKTGATTFTFVHTGAAGTAATGTVTPVRVIPPAPAGTFTQNSVLNAPIKVLLYSSSTSPTSSSVGYQFHSTQPPVDAGNTYLLVNKNSGWDIFTIADGAFSCTPNESGGASLRWDRTVANKMWRLSGTSLQYKTSYAPSNCGGSGWTTENDFGTSHSCTVVSMGYGESRSTTVGGRVAIGCQTGASPNTYKHIVWNVNTHTVDGLVTGPAAGFGDPDWIHIVEASDDSLLGLGIRSLTSGPTGCTAARVGDVVTFTCSAGSFDHVTAGEKFRTFKCAANEYNRLWTIDSATTSTVVATQAGLSASSTTACRIGTQWRGVQFWKNVSGTLTFENSVRWVGAHGEWGRDQDDEAVWVGTVNEEPVCSLTWGAVAHKGLASYWTAGTSNYADGKQCILDYRPYNSGASDNNISMADGWVSLSPRSTNSVGPQAAETSLTSAWSSTQWPAYEGEIIVCKLVAPSEPNVCYRQTHAYNSLDNYTTYLSFSDNRRWLTWNCNFRYANGTQRGAICAIDLGSW